MSTFIPRDYCVSLIPILEIVIKHKTGNSFYRCIHLIGVVKKPRLDQVVTNMRASLQKPILLDHWRVCDMRVQDVSSRPRLWQKNLLNALIPLFHALMTMKTYVGKFVLLKI